MKLDLPHNMRATDAWSSSEDWPPPLRSYLLRYDKRFNILSTTVSDLFVRVEAHGCTTALEDACYSFKVEERQLMRHQYSYCN